MALHLLGSSRSISSRLSHSFLPSLLLGLLLLPLPNYVLRSRLNLFLVRPRPRPRNLSTHVSTPLMPLSVPYICEILLSCAWISICSFNPRPVFHNCPSLPLVIIRLRQHSLCKHTIRLKLLSFCSFYLFLRLYFL